MPPKTRKALLLLTSVAAICLSAVAIVSGNYRYPSDSSINNLSAKSVPSVVDEKRSPSIPAEQAISICSQHAPKCPLTAAGWPGEPDGWQYTGKKWIWVPGTRDLNRSVVWEYSQPYSGSVAAYSGQREDHYAFCSGDNPLDCSLIGGTMPETYDWERWMQVGDNFKVMQLGVESEVDSHMIGDVDCDSGLFYPVVDHTTPYAYTPMYTDISGKCTGGGYISAHLSEMWGEPLSQKRLEQCDNPLNGMPPDLSLAGNTVCKISPYVGVVYQRYVFDSAPPNNLPGLGCEAVLYAWGWSEPRSQVSGQQYQAWFRNGELRFTRWYNLNNQVTGDIPKPDDHDWWDNNCQGAWTDEGNWLYTGTFRAGNAEYDDQVELPVPDKTEITPGGGEVTLSGSGVKYIFPAGSFTETVQVVSYLPDQAELPPADGLFMIAPAHYIFAEASDDFALQEPIAPYTVTLHYSDQQVGNLEGSLAWYVWDGYEWLKEASSRVDLENNTLTATPDHLSLWAAMLEGLRIYLPNVLLGE